MNSESALRELGRRFGLEDRGHEVQRLLLYLRLLEKWNARINLTASTAWPAIGVLFEEALWAAGFFPEGGARHLDIGSGAGFPSIPLHIVRPALRLELLESRVKRAVFLESAVAELKLSGTAVVCQRAESYLRRQAAFEFDVISWKGIRISREAFDLLMEACRPGARFWIFHGGRLPVADPAELRRRLTLVRSEEFPGRPGWQLSIYEKGC